MADSDQTEKNPFWRIRPFAEIRDSIYPGLIPYEMNEKRLTGLVHRRFLDLAVVFYVAVFQDDGFFGSMLISRTLAELWGITESALHVLAFENGKKQPAVTLTLPQIVKEYLTDRYRALGYAPEKIQAEVDPAVEKVSQRLHSDRRFPEGMFYLTNHIRCYGAACILYPDVLRKLSGEGKRDLYLIPAGIHGIFLVPAGERTDVRYMKERAEEFLRRERGRADWLSDHLYRYLADRDVIEMVPLQE